MNVYDQPISSKFRFKEYTRKTYREEFGVDAPPIDLTLPQKSWLDAAVMSLSGRDWVIYDWAVVYTDNGISPKLHPVTGQPQMDKLVLPRKFAAMVNLPPELGIAGIELGAPVAVPCYPLKANEQLVLAPGPMGSGTILVRDMALFEQAQAEVDNSDGFHKADRELLREVLTLLRARQS